MPFRCKTEQRRIDPARTGGKVTELPYCVEHRCWFFLCQHRSVPGLPKADVVELRTNRKGI